MYAIIKHRALSVDNQFMPLFLYATPMDIIAETENTITVQWHNSEIYTYTFDKKNIDRRFNA